MGKYFTMRKIEELRAEYLRPGGYAAGWRTYCDANGFFGLAKGQNDQVGRSFNCLPEEEEVKAMGCLKED